MPPTASGADRSETIRRRPPDEVEHPRSGLVSVLVGLSFFGASILRPDLGSNIAYVDVAIALLILLALLGARVRGTRATTTAMRALPWLWLILVGSAMGLWGVGVPLWAVSSLTRTVLAIGAFFAFWHIIDIHHVERPAIIGTAAGLFVNVASAITGAGDKRARGFIGSPNYLGHYAALAGIVLFATSRRPWSKAAALALSFVGIYLSASFGAMLMVATALLVLLVRVAIRHSGMLAATLLAFAGISLALTLVSVPVSFDSDAEVSSTINQRRFERSQASRGELWGQAWDSFVDQPTGLGPDGVKQREVAVRRHAQEVHSDSFGYLVERSVPGLVGYVGLWATLWAASRRGGLARILIPTILVAGLVRETMHWRHGWLLLALVFALDYRRSDDDDDPAEADTAPELTAT